VVNGKNASEVDQQDQFVEMVNVNQEKAVVVAHKIAEIAHREAVEVILPVILKLMVQMVRSV
jgi:hypothetical protein